MIISFCCATAASAFLPAFRPLRVVRATYTPLFLSSTEGPYEAPRDTDPSWQLEITVSGASAPLPLTNSQCCSVKWSVPQTREQHRCHAGITSELFPNHQFTPFFFSLMSCSSTLISTWRHLPPSFVVRFFFMLHDKLDSYFPEFEGSVYLEIEEINSIPLYLQLS